MSAGPELPKRTREVVLVRYPTGPPLPEDFAIVERDVPQLGDGQLLVENAWISLDPAQRVRMSPSAGGYMPPFALGSVPTSWAVGTVLASRAKEFAVGDLVLHNEGWQELAVVGDTAARKPRVVIPGERVGPVDFLGPLGWPGLTAYAGLFDVAGYREGETVFVSGAAGGVGSLVVQLAHHAGAEVIASVGSHEKARFVKELGADQAICYRDGNIRELLPEVLSRGVDVYFDNVGGTHLEAAMDVMRPGGRVALCGSVSTYNSDGGAPGPSNLFLATAKGLTLRGYLARMYEHRFEDSSRHFRSLLDQGKLVSPYLVVEGLDRLAEGFIGMLAGTNTGKTVVRVNA